MGHRGARGSRAKDEAPMVTHHDSADPVKSHAMTGLGGACGGAALAARDGEFSVRTAAGAECVTGRTNSFHDTSPARHAAHVAASPLSENAVQVMQLDTTAYAASGGAMQEEKVDHGCLYNASMAESGQSPSKLVGLLPMAEGTPRKSKRRMLDELPALSSPEAKASARASAQVLEAAAASTMAPCPFNGGDVENGPLLAGPPLLVALATGDRRTVAGEYGGASTSAPPPGTVDHAGPFSVSSGERSVPRLPVCEWMSGSMRSLRCLCSGEDGRSPTAVGDRSMAEGSEVTSQASDGRCQRRRPATQCRASVGSLISPMAHKESNLDGEKASARADGGDLDESMGGGSRSLLPLSLMLHRFAPQNTLPAAPLATLAPLYGTHRGARVDNEAMLESTLNDDPLAHMMEFQAQPSGGDDRLEDGHSVDSPTEMASLDGAAASGFSHSPRSKAPGGRRYKVALADDAVEASTRSAVAVPQECHPVDRVVNVEILDRIGRGAFGDVFQGVDIDTGSLVAVKEVLVQRDPFMDFERQLGALEREVRVMRKLSHPNIVNYLGSRRIDNALLIYMEYVDNGTVTARLKDRGPFDEEEARFYSKQLLCGLNYLHERHVVHRDLKGDNLFLTSDHVLKVGDFGTSKELQTMCVTDSVAGTPNFMAPEVIACSGHSFMADVWSLGCCVIEMLTGQPPFCNMDNHMAVMFAIMRGRIEQQIPDGISASARSFIEECTRKEPEVRSTTAQLLRHPWIAGGGFGQSDRAASSCVSDRETQSLLSADSCSTSETPPAFSTTEPGPARCRSQGRKADSKNASVAAGGSVTISPLRANLPPADLPLAPPHHCHLPPPAGDGVAVVLDLLHFPSGTNENSPHNWSNTNTTKSASGRGSRWAGTTLPDIQERKPESHGSDYSPSYSRNTSVCAEAQCGISGLGPIVRKAVGEAVPTPLFNRSDRDVSTPSQGGVSTLVTPPLEETLAAGTPMHIVTSTGSLAASSGVEAFSPSSKRLLRGARASENTSPAYRRVQEGTRQRRGASKERDSHTKCVKAYGSCGLTKSKSPQCLSPSSLAVMTPAGTGGDSGGKAKLSKMQSREGSERGPGKLPIAGGPLSKGQVGFAPTSSLATRSTPTSSKGGSAVESRCGLGAPALLSLGALTPDSASRGPSRKPQKSPSNSSSPIVRVQRHLRDDSRSVTSTTRTSPSYYPQPSPICELSPREGIDDRFPSATSPSPMSAKSSGLKASIESQAFSPLSFPLKSLAQMKGAPAQTPRGKKGRKKLSDDVSLVAQGRAGKGKPVKWGVGVAESHEAQPEPASPPGNLVVPEPPREMSRRASSSRALHRLTLRNRDGGVTKPLPSFSSSHALSDDSVSREVSFLRRSMSDMLEGDCGKGHHVHSRTPDRGTGARCAVLASIRNSLSIPATAADSPRTGDLQSSGGNESRMRTPSGNSQRRVPPTPTFTGPVDEHAPRIDQDSTTALSTTRYPTLKPTVSHKESRDSAGGTPGAQRRSGVSVDQTAAKRASPHRTAGVVSGKLAVTRKRQMPPQ